MNMANNKYVLHIKYCKEGNKSCFLDWSWHVLPRECRTSGAYMLFTMVRSTSHDRTPCHRSQSVFRDSVRCNY